jgi:DNA-binding response OmpR family regulator/tetratricopeptide (TPR) repeat protein
MSVSSTAPEPASAEAELSVASPVRRLSPLDGETLGDRPADARRVLVVEPDAGARSLVRLGLVREGFQVSVVSSAEEAERELAQGQVVPGVVVAEVGLEGADGISLCQRLRAHPRLRDVPVLLLAARPTPGDLERAGRAGADDYLPKPLFVSDLATLVRLRAGHAARDATLDSHTDVLSLSAALRALLAGSSSGRLFLEANGQLLFRRGEVVSVRFEGVDGERGLTRMLALGRGGYRVHLGPVLARGELSTGLRELCGRLGAELSVWERLVAVSVPLEAVLQPDFEVLRASLPALPREAELLLRLFDGTRSLRDVILASNLPEVPALRAASRLYATGVLLPEALARENGRAPYLPGVWEALERAPASEAASVEESTVPVEGRPQPPLAEPVRTPPFSRALKPPSAPAEPPTLHLPEDSPLEAAARTLARVYQPKPPGPGAHPEDVWADDVAAGLRRRSARLTTVAVLAAVLALGATATAIYAMRRSEGPLAPPHLPTLEASAQAVPADVPAAALAASVPDAVKEEKVATPAISVPAEGSGGPVPGAEGAASAPVPAAAAQGGHTLAEGIALYRAALPSAAVRVLDEVVQATPDVPVAWLYLALARFDAGDVRGAEGAAMKAVALDAKEPRAHLLLAGIHLGRGERTKANAELSRVLVLEPEGPEADDARRLLRDAR